MNRFIIWRETGEFCFFPQTMDWDSLSISAKLYWQRTRGNLYRWGTIGSVGWRAEMIEDVLGKVSVRSCWDVYAKDHLRGTVGRNAGYWHNLKWFAYIEAQALSPKEVEQYISLRTNRDGAKVSTIIRELGMLRAALRFAERNGLIAKAPIIKSPRVQPTKVRSLSREEASKLIRFADNGNWREQVYVRLGLGTGARPGAICDLKWDQVDQEAVIIDFRKTGHPLYDRLKKRAVVPINPMVRAALAIADSNRNGDYVLHWNGRPLSSPRPLMRRICKAAGVRDCSPHVLRHTVASLLLQEGEDLLKVSRLLGHSSSRVTEQVYFQHQPQWLKQAAAKLQF